MCNTKKKEKRKKEKKKVFAQPCKSCGQSSCMSSLYTTYC